MGPEPLDVEDLIRRAERQEVLAGADGKTAAPLVRILVEGEWYVVKHLSHELDWLARAAGDIGCNAYLAWERGLYAALPAEIDAAVVGARREGRGAVLVMRDVSDLLVPAGDEPVPHDQHRRFVSHVAAMHAHFAGGRATAYDLTPLPMKYTMLSELTARVEADRGHEGGVPGILATASPRLRSVAPEAGAVATALAADPWPLVSAFEGSPTTLSHGDCKYGNFGSHPDGRTILLDWAAPGVAPFCCDLAYYLAINSRRFAEPKEAAIDAYREEPERRGISTLGWFERQLELALLGAFVQLGWEKADEPAELGWWVERVLPTARPCRSRRWRRRDGRLRTQGRVRGVPLPGERQARRGVPDGEGR